MVNLIVFIPVKVFPQIFLPECLLIYSSYSGFSSFATKFFALILE